VLSDPPLDESAIIFIHSSKRRYYSKLPGTHITLTGWEMRSTVVQTGPNHYNVSYSDHATFREIVQYLREARPKIVIVDGSRSSKASLTAKYIERMLGIPAISLP
jgi:putative mRNA 3-end processing factor